MTMTNNKNYVSMVEVRVSTREKLKSLKRGYFETYDAVILRLLKRYEETK
jgi:hypothetical protein